MKKLLSFLFLLSGFYVHAQLAPHKYFIEFKDKNQNPYSLAHPEQFLTQRAIDRRTAMGIGYDLDDLPVTPLYLQTIQSLGAQILNPTKWLNGTTIYLADTILIDTISKLPFVNSVVKDRGVGTRVWEPVDKFSIENHSAVPINENPVPKSSLSYNYGASYSQIHQVNGIMLHENGFRGAGKVIAQLDAGFYNVNNLPGFDSLRAYNQLLGHKDFVKDGASMFDNPQDTHGMNVLSIMVGNLPGQIIGTGPRASYWLLRTEEAQYEFITEEYNWVSGAEFADSVGADIITSSLGYTVFDSAYHNHTCADMNGHYTVCSRGANTAFSKGIVVIVSAGNDGLKSWHCVSAPADADAALAIAAVDSNGIRALFSSLGVDTAGRVKPNIAAMGEADVVMAEQGGTRRGSGTSFSAPVVAGMTACLMQAKPGFPNTFYRTAIERSGSHAANPDSLTGYGIPDFNKAISIMGLNEVTRSNRLNIYPNPASSLSVIEYYAGQSGEARIRFTDETGRTVASIIRPVRAGENKFKISDLINLPAGVYLVNIIQGDQNITAKLIRLPE